MFGLPVAVARFAVFAVLMGAPLAAQDVDVPDASPDPSAGTGALGPELYVEGDGDNPWPEMSVPKKVRKARRTVGGTNDACDNSSDETVLEDPALLRDCNTSLDPLENYEIELDHQSYLDSLDYVEGPGIKSPPGMLVVAPNQRTSFILSAGQPAVQRRPVVRSTGGSRVGKLGAPWQAQIFFPKVAKEFKPMLAAKIPLWALQHYCGGALVATGWVITAAHCIDDDMRKAGYKIRLGQKNLNEGAGWTYRIDQVFRYSPYAPRKGGDLALIKISSDTGKSPPPSEVRPIPLFKGGDLPAGRPVNVYGWGRQNDTGLSASQILMTVDLETMDRTMCTPQGKRLGWTISQSFVCAKAPDGTDRKTCSGDSGGPVVDGVTKQLVAVVSGGGPKCAKDNDPSFYTRIGAFLPWIKKTTNGAVN